MGCGPGRFDPDECMFLAMRSTLRLGKCQTSGVGRPFSGMPVAQSHLLRASPSMPCHTTLPT